MQVSLSGNIRAIIMAIGFICFIAAPAFSSDFKTLRTPNKTEIMGYIFSQLPQEEIEKKDAQYERIVKEAGWNVKKIKTSSSTYNGHGYAWHMSQGGAEIVIEGDDIVYYWMDGSYRQIDDSEAKKGDIIVITDPENPTSVHSAVVADKPRWCKSKWHDGPLFLHKIDEQPFGTTFTFYRRAIPAAPQNLRIVR